jgi:hypothetical protein
MDNRAFWNDRYATLPVLGSGPGSRGWVADYKRWLVGELIAARRPRTLVDIGCGDLCWLDEGILSQVAYLGVDIADRAVEMGRERFPTATFRRHDVVATPIDPPADMVVCFDVLLHQVAWPDLEQALRHVLASMRSVGLVSYLTPPSPDGEPQPAGPETVDAPPEWLAHEAEFQAALATLPGARPKGQTAFHGPLPDLVRRIDAAVTCSEIGRHRLQTVYRLDRPAG